MICLVIPPSGFLLDDRVFMSLGILRVAAALEKAGEKVEVLDLSGIANYEDVVADLTTSAEIFGITATTPQLPCAVKIAQALRKKGKVILGGPHVTLVNAAYKKGSARAVKALRSLRESFDVLVAGDGEEAVFAAIKEDAPWLVDADDRKSPMFLDDKRLDALPWPARHLIDIESYKYSIDGFPAVSIIAQMGCPFFCGFCGGRSSPTLRNIRMRTSENIVAEIEHLWRTTGRTGFMFYDDELNVNKNMVQLMNLIAERQKELGVEWRLRGFIKAELFTHEQAAAMYRAGFRWILVGFESGSERILVNINKRATKADNTRCIEIAKSHGLKVKALMSLGHPGESPQTIEDTKQWLMEVKPDDFDATVITCYPGTPYYDEAVNEGAWVYTHPKTGDRLYQIEVDYTTTQDYYKGGPGGYEAYVFTDHLTPEQLVSLRDEVERDVRESLGIPYNASVAARLYEHSMGQLPNFVLKAA